MQHESIATLVVASQHNNRLQCCLRSLKRGHHVHLLWDGGDKPIDFTGLPSRHRVDVYTWREIRIWVLLNFDIQSEVLDAQTTLKKSFFYLYLFRHGITRFFYTDDDVYFWEDPAYSGTLAYTVDAHLGVIIANRAFYKKHFPRYHSYYDAVNRACFPFVGNFNVEMQPSHIDLYERMLRELLSELVVISDWGNPVDTANHNTNVFYIDSFFLDAFFFELMKQSSSTVRRVSDWIILAGCLNAMIDGDIRQDRCPKGRTLVHYNIGRKSLFFDYFFMKDYNG